MSPLVTAAARANWPSFDEAPPTVQNALRASISASVAAVLRSLAAEARWMEYPASSDPRHWAQWLEAHADEVDA